MASRVVVRTHSAYDVRTDTYTPSRVLGELAGASESKLPGDASSASSSSSSSSTSSPPIVAEKADSDPVLLRIVAQKSAEVADLNRRLSEADRLRTQEVQDARMQARVEFERRLGEVEDENRRLSDVCLRSKAQLSREAGERRRLEQCCKVAEERESQRESELASARLQLRLALEQYRAAEERREDAELKGGRLQVQVHELEAAVQRQTRELHEMEEALAREQEERRRADEARGRHLDERSRYIAGLLAQLRGKQDDCTALERAREEARKEIERLQSVVQGAELAAAERVDRAQSELAAAKADGARLEARLAAAERETAMLREDLERGRARSEAAELLARETTAWKDRSERAEQRVAEIERNLHDHGSSVTDLGTRLAVAEAEAQSLRSAVERLEGERSRALEALRAEAVRAEDAGRRASSAEERLAEESRQHEAARASLETELGRLRESLDSLSSEDAAAREEARASLARRQRLFRVVRLLTLRSWMANRSSQQREAFYHWVAVTRSDQAALSSRQVVIAESVTDRLLDLTERRGLHPALQDPGWPLSRRMPAAETEGGPLIRTTTATTAVRLAVQAWADRVRLRRLARERSRLQREAAEALRARVRRREAHDRLLQWHAASLLSRLSAAQGRVQELEAAAAAAQARAQAAEAQVLAQAAELALQAPKPSSERAVSGGGSATCVASVATSTSPISEAKRFDQAVQTPPGRRPRRESLDTASIISDAPRPRVRSLSAARGRSRAPAAPTPTKGKGTPSKKSARTAPKRSASSSSRRAPAPAPAPVFAPVPPPAPTPVDPPEPTPMAPTTAIPPAVSVVPARSGPVRALPSAPPARTAALSQSNAATQTLDPLLIASRSPLLTAEGEAAVLLALGASLMASPDDNRPPSSTASSASSSSSSFSSSSARRRRGPPERPRVSSLVYGSPLVGPGRSSVEALPVGVVRGHVPQSLRPGSEPAVSGWSPYEAFEVPASVVFGSHHLRDEVKRFEPREPGARSTSAFMPAAPAIQFSVDFDTRCQDEADYVTKLRNAFFHVLATAFPSHRYSTHTQRQRSRMDGVRRLHSLENDIHALLARRLHAAVDALHDEMVLPAGATARPSALDAFMRRERRQRSSSASDRRPTEEEKEDAAMDTARWVDRMSTEEDRASRASSSSSSSSPQPPQTVDELLDDLEGDPDKDVPLYSAALTERHRLRRRVQRFLRRWMSGTLGEAVVLLLRVKWTRHRVSARLDGFDPVTSVRVGSPSLAERTTSALGPDMGILRAHLARPSAPSDSRGGGAAARRGSTSSHVSAEDGDGSGSAPSSRVTEHLSSILMHPSVKRGAADAVAHSRSPLLPRRASIDEGYRRRSPRARTLEYDEREDGEDGEEEDDDDLSKEPALIGLLGASGPRRLRSRTVVGKSVSVLAPTIDASVGGSVVSAIDDARAIVLEREDVRFILGECVREWQRKAEEEVVHVRSEAEAADEGGLVWGGARAAAEHEREMDRLRPVDTMLRGVMVEAADEWLPLLDGIQVEADRPGPLGGATISETVQRIRSFDLDPVSRVEEAEEQLSGTTDDPFGDDSSGLRSRVAAVATVGEQAAFQPRRFWDAITHGTQPLGLKLGPTLLVGLARFLPPQALPRGSVAHAAAFRSLQKRSSRMLRVAEGDSGAARRSGSASFASSATGAGRSGGRVWDVPGGDARSFAGNSYAEMLGSTASTTSAEDSAGAEEEFDVHDRGVRLDVVLGKEVAALVRRLVSHLWRCALLIHTSSVARRPRRFIRRERPDLHSYAYAVDATTLHEAVGAESSASARAAPAPAASLAASRLDADGRTTVTGRTLAPVRLPGDGTDDGRDPERVVHARMVGLWRDMPEARDVHPSDLEKTVSGTTALESGRSVVRFNRHRRLLDLHLMDTLLSLAVAITSGNLMVDAMRVSDFCE